MYFVNEYRFHTKGHETGLSTTNSCVAIPSEYVNYYGRIIEIIQIEYPGMPLKHTVLFKCEWFDPTKNVGVRVHDEYGLVDVNRGRRFNKFEPFILAMQATQVCYVPYPTTRRVRNDWEAVCRVKPRGWIEATRKSPTDDNAPFQETMVEENELTSYEPVSLTHENPQYVYVGGDEHPSDEDIEPDVDSSTAEDEEGEDNEPDSDSD